MVAARTTHNIFIFKVNVSIGRILKQTSSPQKIWETNFSRCSDVLGGWAGVGRHTNFVMYINREVKAEGLTGTYFPVASCLPFQTCWLLNGCLELLFGQLHCFCWTSVPKNTDKTAGVGRKREKNNLAELQHPSIIKYREDAVLSAKSYSVLNQLILVFPPLLPVKSLAFWKRALVYTSHFTFVDWNISVAAFPSSTLGLFSCQKRFVHPRRTGAIMYANIRD